MRLVALQFLLPAILQACSCVVPAPVCQMFTEYPVIFRGTVVSQAVADMNVRVDFAVAETFRGQRVQLRSINTHQQSSACGFPFKDGLEYLVFASSDKDGNLVVSTCSGTHQVDRSGQDANITGQDAGITWMRQYPTASPTATIFGGLSRLEDFANPRLDIRIRGPENRDLTTGPDGRYSAAGLPPGTYTVSASVPAGFGTGNSRTVTIAEKGCQQIDWFVFRR
jgi:hypothetical protein